ncbi:protein SAE3 [Kluyveromyces marxianus]|uniref:Protein SAE3 n=1 Tax=Kluyveromyces marxianus TaxID=4911 RepID=A0ABX6ENM0_KLUMA|nr:protein SAE3 [Kluyveromyces marxianus]
MQVYIHIYITKTPEKVNQQHIEDLKLYNELRDTGLRLVQMVADEKQCKIKDVFEEIGYDMED